MSNVSPNLYQRSIATTGNVITIASGQTISDTIQTYDLPLLSIQFPANFTASNVTFLCSLDGVNFDLLKDVDNNIPTVSTVAASDFRYITTTWLAGSRFFRLQTSVAQANDVNILLGLRRVD